MGLGLMKQAEVGFIMMKFVPISVKRGSYEAIKTINDPTLGD